MMLLEPQVSWGYFLALGVSVALIMLLVIILANWLSGKYQPIKDSISSRLPIESPARGKLLAAGISLMAGVSAMATPLLLVVAISILSVGLLLFTASPMLGVSKANEHLKTGLCHDFEWTKRESREVVTGCNVIKVKGEDAIEKAYIVYRNSKFFYIHTKEKAITLPISSVDSIEVALQRNPNANANLEQEKEG